MPGSPPGISVKSAQPSGRARVPARRSATVNGQWSVATVCTAPVAMPCHSSSACHGSRSGGVHTNDVAVGTGRAARCRGRGTAGTSPRTRRPRARALRAPRRARVPTTGARGTPTRPRTSASDAARCTASASRIAGRVAACSSTPVRPAASAWRRSASMAPPFSQCSVTSPPWRVARQHHVDDHVVVDLQQLGVRHVELERRDARLDAVGDHPLGHPLGERHVQAVVDARGLGEPAPRRERGERVLAAVRGDVVDDRRRAADGRGARARREVVAHVHRADGQVEVRVHVDAAGHDETPGAVDDLSRRRAARASSRDLGDASVASDAHVGATLAVDIDHDATREKHAVRVTCREPARRIHRRAVRARLRPVRTCSPRSTPRPRTGSPSSSVRSAARARATTPRWCPRSRPQSAPRSKRAPPASRCRSPAGSTDRSLGREFT